MCSLRIPYTQDPLLLPTLASILYAPPLHMCAHHRMQHDPSDSYSCFLLPHSLIAPLSIHLRSSIRQLLFSDHPFLTFVASLDCVKTGRH